MMKRFFLIFLLLPFLLRANSDAIFSDNEDLTLCHHVNVISGNLNLYFQDALIQGPQPLSLVRTYSSSGAFERRHKVPDQLCLEPKWLIQGGWNILPHIHLFIQLTEEASDLKIYLPEKNGTFVNYLFSHQENDLIVLKPEIKAGQCSGSLSARTNFHNNVLKLQREKKEAVLFLPDGGKRYYRDLFSSPEESAYYFNLTSELTPSGQNIHYSYKQGVLRGVSLNSCDNQRCFAWMRFDLVKAGEGKDPFHFHVSTSDEKSLDYKSVNSKSRNYLSDVRSNCRPQESAHFSSARKGIGARMESLTLADQLQFAVKYYKPPSEKLEKEWADNPKKKAFVTDKVHVLEAPAGPQGQMRPIVTFFYSQGLTEVRDIDYNLTRYYHDQTRLHTLEYCDPQDQLHSSLKLIWQEEQLLKAKAFLKSDGQALFSRSFNYDSGGNVIEEVLWGNLTGAAPDSFLLQADGTLVGAESYRKRYAYLPGFNVPTLEEEEDGLTYLYLYKPDTNLLSAKFICDQDRILIRQFLFYNQDNLLTAEFTDDGSSTHPQDLSHVTERLSKRYDIDFATGLTKSVRETYLDLNSGTEKLLKRTEFTHSGQKLPITEAVYDANNTYRYTLYTDYDSQGRIIRKTTPQGQQNTYTYDSLGHLLESKEVGSFKKLFSYDALGQSTSCEEVHFDGTHVVSYTHYDSKGRLLSQTDKRGNTTTQTYDTFGRCLRTELPQVKNEAHEAYTPTIHFTYDALGNLASTTSPRGDTTHTVYNTLRKPIQITQADGTQIFHFYNKKGTLSKTRYSDHTEIHYTYDRLQRMTSKITYADTGKILSQETWEYNAFHLLSHTEPQGLTTCYSYDGAGRLVLEQSGERQKTYTYDSLGFLERTSDGNLTKIQLHDESGRITQEWTEDLEGHRENEMHFFYDEENRKIQAMRLTSQGESLDRFFYDSEGHLTRHEDPLGAVTQFLFTEVKNDLGQRVLQKATLDPLGNATIETFDALDHLILCEKKNPQGQTVAKEAYFYDTAGNRSKRLSTIYHQNQPIKEVTTSWEYDCLGHVIKQDEAQQKISTYTYDCRGRLQTYTLPSNITLFHSYDGLGRLTDLRSSDQTIHLQYIYEKGPDPVQISDLVQNTFLKRSYNSHGELTEEINPYGLHFQWQYDNFGRRTCFTLPDHSSIIYTYSGAHLQTITRKSPSGQKLYTHRYTHFDPNGHVQEEELIFHLGTIKTSHDLLERPSSQTSRWLTQTLAYGPSHLVTRAENSLFGKKDYAYDALNQLVKEGEQNYSFDSLGNPTQCEVDDCNQILSSPDAKLHYDPDGNPIERLTSTHTTTYRYDALGRLIEISEPTQKIIYQYDPLSRLLAKEVHSYSWWSWHTEKSFYLYDRDAEIGTLSSEKQITELKVLGLGIKGDIGGAIAIELSGATYVPLHDFQGNIIALLSSLGKIVEKYQFDAFGKETTATTSSNPWRFCSKRAEAGLVFFGLRFYDPSLGRWLTPDPSGDVEGPNLYLYVLNNPVNRLDLFGLSSDPLAPPWPEREGITIELTPSQITNASSIRDVILCKGTINGVEVDWVVSCAYWHKLQFTAEELAIGKVNIMDHFHEIVPKDAVGISMVTFQNGMDVKRKDFKLSAQSLADKLPDTFFLSLYNPTKGVVADLIRVLGEKHGKDTPAICRTRQFMVAVADLLRDVSPNLFWLHISHSEASLLGNRAIEGMDPEHKEFIKAHLLSVALGPAEPISNMLTKNAINIYSKKDYVTKRFAEPFLKDRNYDIQFVNCISPMSERTFFFADHAIKGATYQKSIYDQIGKADIDYGFYYDKNR